MRRVYFGFALLAIALTQLNATSYYVDYLAGSDSNSGTNLKLPWKHCPGDPAATGNVANASLSPGDTVLFKGGVTYVFTSTAGIALNWSGAPGAVITYDGNSTGNWGIGRARFTDNHSSLGITAFHASGFAQHLNFKSLEFSAIGGTPSLPWDASSAVEPKYGAGIAFASGCASVTIEGCGFRELGYWYNQKPMNAASIRGTGISSQGADGLTISNCDFSRVANGVDLPTGNAFANVEITQCTFRDAIVWPINLPSTATGSNTGVAVRESTFLEDDFFSLLQWLGYGHSPRTEVVEVSGGTHLSFAASAVSSPAATFQWRKNGVSIPGATNPVLNLNAVGIADSGIYTAEASNSGGSTVSNSAVVIVDGNIVQEVLPMVSQTASLALVGKTADTMAVAPLITTHPVDQVVTVSAAVTLMASASGTPAAGYQWRKNGTDIFGATNPAITFAAVTVDDAGQYSMVATNSVGFAVSNEATLTVTIVQNPYILPPPPPPLTDESPPPAPNPTQPPSPPATSSEGVLQLATQMLTLEVGGHWAVPFTVEGSVPKTILVRAVGPTLSTIGVTDALPDPQFFVDSGKSIVGQNDNWGGSSELIEAFNRTGAIPFVGVDSGDSALLLTLSPGPYTVLVSGVNGLGGTVLVDVYVFP